MTMGALNTEKCTAGENWDRHRFSSFLEKGICTLQKHGQILGACNHLYEFGQLGGHAFHGVPITVKSG